MARANLGAVRQRVERLAAAMASADAISTWTDEHLAAELRALLVRVDPCPACRYDLAGYALGVAGDGCGDLTALGACPQCGASTGLIGVQG